MSRYNDFFEWADPIDRARYTFAPEALDAADKVREVFPFNTLGGRATALSPLVEDVRKWAADQGFSFPDDQLNAFVDYVSSGCAWDYPYRAKEKNPKRFNIFGVAWHLEKASLRRALTTPPEPFTLRGVELRWLEPREITFADVDKVLTEHTALTDAGYGVGSGKAFPIGNSVDSVNRMLNRVRKFAPWVIDNVPVQKSVAGDVHFSYKWKHIVERGVGEYMSNTDFIVLALVLGIPLRIDGELNPDVGVPRVVGDILDKRAQRAKRLAWKKARS